MGFLYGFVFLTILVFLYFFYTSYLFQFMIHKYRIKKTFLNEFGIKVKGKFVSSGYFATNHKVISRNEYRALSNREKINFSKCYNIIRFKTADVNWELYFHLIKEGMSFSEVFNLRAFPRSYKIKSEGNVEKNYSRLNVFTNNYYLTEILEKKANNNLKWLLRHNADIMLISSNNLHYKAFFNSNKITYTRGMDMVKAMNGVKHEIYKKDVIEY